MYMISAWCIHGIHNTQMLRSEEQQQLNTYPQLHMPEVAMLVQAFALLPEGAYCFTTQS
jgi:hypothetical protein